MDARTDSEAMTGWLIPDRRRRQVGGLWDHVQPIFFVPGIAVSLVGAVLTPDPSIATAIVHATAVALAVYVAHLTDGYVDYYVRGEDEQNRLSSVEIRVATLVTVIAFGFCVLVLWVSTGPLAALATAPLVALGYLHAPHLDTNPITTTVDYPAGIALATVGGYTAQTGTVSAVVGTIALVLVVLLSGIGILLDTVDYEHDATVSKRTVPVVLGPERALSVSKWLVVASSGIVLCVSVLAVVPPIAAVVGLLPAATVVAWNRGGWPVDVAVNRLIATTYVFMAVFVLTLLFDSSTSVSSIG